MKKQLFVLPLLAICLFVLSGCKSDLEKVIEEERKFIDVSYADISVLELSNNEFDTKYSKMLEEHKGDYISWTGKISSLNSLFNELRIEEEGLPELVIDFEFDIADYLKENDYKENDIITISALLHDYIDGKGGFLELKNGRVEVTSDNEKKKLETFRTAYIAKKDTRNQQLIAESLSYDIISTEKMAKNSLVYHIQIEEKFVNMHDLEDVVREIHEIEKLKSNKYDAIFIDFYLTSTESYTSDNTIADAHIVYTNIGRAQALLDKEKIFDIIIKNSDGTTTTELFEL